MSVYVVADLDSAGGLALIKEALSCVVRFIYQFECYMILITHEQDTVSLIRVSFIHNPTHVINGETSQQAPTSRLISHLLSTKTLSKASPSRLLRALGPETPVFPNGDSQVPISEQESLSELLEGVTVEPESYTQYVKTSRLVLRELQLTPGQQALIIDGRVGAAPLLMIPELHFHASPNRSSVLSKAGISSHRISTLWRLTNFAGELNQ
jgi:hypothetical protein